MNSMVLLLALAVPTVNYGWRPGGDGQLEYIIQLESEALDALRSGKEISSDIHPDARGVRRFVLRFGDGEVPRELPVEQKAHVARATRPAGHAVYMMGTGAAEQGWQPGTDGRLEYLIQLDEVALEALEAGEEITSELHPEAQDVQRFVVRFGSTELPRVAVTPASGVGGNAGRSRTASTMLQADSQYGAAPAANPRGRYAAPEVTGAESAPNDPRYTDPYARTAAGEVPPADRYGGATRAQVSGAGGNRYSGGTVASEPAIDYSSPRQSSPSLLQPPSTLSVEPTNTVADTDPDDETTIARADRWQSSPTGTGDEYVTPPEAERWPPARQSYPETDWRQPPYEASTGAPRSDMPLETRTASGRPASQTPIFSRPGGRTPTEEYDDEYERSPVRVAENAARPTMSGGSRSVRSNSSADYEGEASPSSLRGERANAPDGDRGSLLKELVLFASLGINVVAVLIARQYYLRYRMLIREMRDPETLVA